MNILANPAFITAIIIYLMFWLPAIGIIFSEDKDPFYFIRKLL